MRNASKVIFASALAGLAACGGTNNGTDAGPVDTGTIPTTDTGNGTDTGSGPRDTGVDANLPPYDGGPTFSCTGLTPVMPSDYCTAYADAFVAQRLRCGLIGSGGATELRAALLDGCDVSRLEAQITAGTVHWDAAQAACCLGHSANDLSCFIDVGGGDDSCNFITGTVANGMPCTSGAECSNGYCHVDGACPGTCTAFAAPGTPCNLGDVVCDADSTCDTGYNGASDVCVRQTGTAGSACNIAMGMGCDPSYECIVPEGSASGTCQARPTRGGACTTDSILCDLNSSICDYDYASEAGLCVPAMPIGSMRCIIDAQCAGDAYCAGANFGGMVYGTCTARAARGASCMTDKCVSGTVCLPSRVCGDVPGMGESCTSATGCAQGICSGSGVCVALHTAGEPCTENSQCASGNCRAVGHTCAPDCTP